MAQRCLKVDTIFVAVPLFRLALGRGFARNVHGKAVVAALLDGVPPAPDAEG
jgi:hypothetical protein